MANRNSTRWGGLISVIAENATCSPAIGSASGHPGGFTERQSEHSTSHGSEFLMTDLARTRSPTPAGASMPVLPTVALGVVGGCALGVIARAWMRLIAEDPEFSVLESS